MQSQKLDPYDDIKSKNGYSKNQLNLALIKVFFMTIWKYFKLIKQGWIKKGISNMIFTNLKEGTEVVCFLKRFALE